MAKLSCYPRKAAPLGIALWRWRAAPSKATLGREGVLDLAGARELFPATIQSSRQPDRAIAKHMDMVQHQTGVACRVTAVFVLFGVVVLAPVASSSSRANCRESEKTPMA